MNDENVLYDILHMWKNNRRLRNIEMFDFVQSKE